MPHGTPVVEQFPASCECEGKIMPNQIGQTGVASQPLKIIYALESSGIEDQLASS
jgi:hypothetical protein